MYGKTTCGLCARRSCPLSSPPHPNIHPPLSRCDSLRGNNKKTGHLRPGLDRLLILIVSRRIFLGGIDTVSNPFHFQNIQFYVDGNHFLDTTTTTYKCAMTTLTSLIFTTQNNGVNVESIGHNETGNPQEYAVAAIRRYVAHLQQHGNSSRSPLAKVPQNGKWYTIRSTDITKAL